MYQEGRLLLYPGDRHWRLKPLPALALFPRYISQSDRQRGFSPTQKIPMSVISLATQGISTARRGPKENRAGLEVPDNLIAGHDLV